MDTQKRILVVEDDELMRDSVIGALKTAGFVILEADNGKDGLATALAQHPDVIVLDIAMPQLDGISVMRSLRQDEWGKTANIILLTSLGVSDLIMHEVATNEPAFTLTKDQITVDEVVAKVKQTLGMNQ